jgi:hypothetical protein
VSVGVRADLIALSVRTNDPLEEILARSAPPPGVWIGGAHAEAT